MQKKGAIRVVKIADNIISPAGNGTDENFKAVLAGKSELRRFEGTFGVSGSFTASLFPDRGCPEGPDFFDSLAVRSAEAAVSDSGIDASSERVIFILSTVKGNVEALSEGRIAEAGPGRSASLLARRFSNPNRPLVVSNACISGVTAIVLAERMLRSGRYDYAVVVGCEVQSSFIISGFLSLKALSDEPCRPFDKSRKGLNAGEAAATVVLAARETVGQDEWEIVCGATRNDANHISGPSRTGEGSFNCLEYVLQDADRDDLAFVNVHGTSTLYNDEMESIALSRAGLSDVPVNALKGFFGHTMGAAGVLETILSMKAVESGVILPTRGYSECGVSFPVNVSPESRPTGKRSFIKLLSGFGGCNAALLCTLGGRTHIDRPEPVLRTSARLRLSPKDGDIVSLYRSLAVDYPKFFKMDPLSKLGFVASESILKDFPDRFSLGKEAGVIVFTSCGSLADDIRFQESLEKEFPSPSLFVYTLPNIVTGEICIRNKFLGDSTAIVLDERDDGLIERTVRDCFRDRDIRFLAVAWLDARSEDDFEAEIALVESLGASK